MLLLTSITDKIRLTTSSVANIDVQASYVDITTTSLTPGRTNTGISSITTTDVVGTPAASTQRQIKSLMIRNRHASTSNTVTVIHTDGTNAMELISLTLAAGEQLQYTDGEGFVVIDSTGSRKIGGGPGRFLQRQIFTSGSAATGTLSNDTRKVRVRMVGGGAGGGGAVTGASAASASNGGNAAAYAEYEASVTPGGTFTYTVGALGAGGTAGNNDGTAGGSSSIVINATTVTAPGGTAGVSQGSGTGNAANTSNAATAVATNGSVNAGGQPGINGLRISGTVGLSGSGGSGPFGAGGPGQTAPGAGVAGLGKGSGGGGALVENGSSSVAGGDGTGGLIIIDEYSG